VGIKVKKNKEHGKLLKKVEKWDKKVGQDSQFVIVCREVYNANGELGEIHLTGLKNIIKAFKIE
jgi:hypothetical protein